MNIKTSLSVMMVVAGLVLTVAPCCSQVGTTAKAPAVSVKRDAITHPFPMVKDSSDLTGWVLTAHNQAREAIREAQKNRDPKEVSRLLVVLEDVRQHAFSEMERVAPQLLPVLRPSRPARRRAKPRLLGGKSGPNLGSTPLGGPSVGGIGAAPAGPTISPLLPITPKPASPASRPNPGLSPAPRPAPKKKDDLDI